MISVLSVSQFIEQINGIIAGEFVVEGEVSQYKISQGKWIFFDLKDDQSVLNCFATVYGLRAPLEDGMKIRVVGYPNIRSQTGKFSLTVQKVELVGEGSLKKAYLLLKQKLSDEGLFATERKRALPYLPAVVGVIASRDSAAFGDFKRILNNRWNGVEILLKHITVQGENAAEEITNAFKIFNQYEKPCDVLVLIRGGGSLEDLAAFNSEEVARAVYGSKIPVICGVGHERDETLADFAADVRASTPSNAAERVVPEKRDFVSQLEMSLSHFSESMQHVLTQRRRAVEQGFYTISARVREPLNQGRGLVLSFNGLIDKLYNSLARKRDFLQSCKMLFANVDPRRVMARGYSITRNEFGAIVRSAQAVSVGAELITDFADGTLASRVMHKKIGTTEKGQGKLI